MTTYKELDYLESSGTQYIDTLWHPQSNNLRVKFKVKSNGTPNLTAICGAEDSTVVPRWVFVMYGQNADTTKTFPLIGDWKNGGAGFTPEGFKFTDGTTLEIDWTANATSTTVTDSVSGTTYTHTFGTTINYLNNTTTLKLFQNNDTQKASIDMYYYQIYDNNTLVRDFIPVLDFNDTPAMYDKVNDVLYYNQGTGEFNYKLKGYYCEVEYLESSGTQYIDTGINADSNMGFDITYALTTPNDQTTTRFGVIRQDDSGSTTVYLRHHMTLSSSQSNSRIQYMLPVYTKELSKDTNIHNLKMDTVNSTFNYDGDVSSYNQAAFDCNLNYYLFGRNDYLSGTFSVTYAKMKMYKCQLYASGELVRDFIPVLDWNMVPCLYDKVTGTKFYNEGTGEFNYGRKIYPVEYIESTGTQYIDTGVCLSNNHSVEISFQMTVTGQKRTGIFGGLCNANTVSSESDYGRYGMLTHYNNAYYEAGYGKTNVVQNVGTQNLNKRLFYQNKNKLYMDGTLVKTFSAATFRMGLSAYLGGFRYTSYTPSKAKYYYSKWWDDTTLVRDYIPAIDENGVGFWFDKITHTIYDNAGTGSFLSGPLLNQYLPDLMLMKKATMMTSHKYNPLKYLESTGTQYIDTGYIPTANTSFELSGVDMDYNSGTTRFGSRVDAKNENYCLTAIASNDFRFTYGSGQSTTSIQYIYNTHKLAKKVSFSASTKVCTITFNDDTIESSPAFNATPLTSSAQSIYLFAFNNNGSAVLGTSKVSALRIFEGNTLVRDMIPVLDTNGIPCMWDRVTNKLFYNQGTGTFAYEEWDYTPCDFVYANGNAYTSTMLYGNSDTKMEMVFDITAQSTQNRGVMGSRGNSANSQLLAIGYGTSVLASDFNNSSYATYRSFIIYDLNTKYRVYTSKEKRSIVVADTGVVLDENNTLCSDNMSTGALLLGAETGLNYRHVGNIYSAKIWDGDILIRDYIPVVDGDNKGGFYDKCLNVISYSIGSSDFVGHIVEGGVDYRVVTYLESAPTSTANGPYINTGINYFADFELKAKQRVSSSMKGCGVDQTHCVERDNATTNAWRFRTGDGSAYMFVTSALVTDLHALKWKDNKVYVDNVKQGDFEKINAINTFLIFASNSTGTQSLNKYALLVYRCKMWDPEDKTLIRYFVPVLRGTEPGMLDLVSKTFFGNAGNDSFSYG